MMSIIHAFLTELGFIMAKHRWFLRLIWCLFGAAIFGLILVALVIVYFELQLPSKTEIKDVHLEVPLRVFTSDGQLIAEYGAERRIPVPLAQIPQDIINATLATEDQRYYSHPGVDILGLLRASVVLVTTGHKEQGGSTITMQVARNYFLNNKKTFNRKIREILLAYKIDHTFSKNKVLELYFNKIFYGNRAYGIAAAAQIYYGKQLNQLTLAECATLAGIPKAPSSLNPLADVPASMDRRNHVLERMLDEGYITRAQYAEATHAPNTARFHGLLIGTKAPYVGEIIRNEMVSKFGQAAYSGDFEVYTTVNSALQTYANETLRNGVLAYDQRHGYRGPVTSLGETIPNHLHKWQKVLKNLPTVNGLQPAVVMNIDDTGRSATAMLTNGMLIIMPWDGMSWARRMKIQDDQQLFMRAPQKPSDIFKVGDVIYVNQLADGWQLSQIPKVEAALISMNPQNGSVLALVGGFDDSENNFNHAVQAYRQPGSGFKPFIYSAALAKGFTLATMINDAPVVLAQDNGTGFWRPENDTRKFYGPTSLLVALTQSRNLVSIRLLQMIGIPYAIDYATRFGFNKNQMPEGLSLALGTASVTPLQMANAYSVFANGGYRVAPHLVNYITDSNGKVIFQPQIAVTPPTKLGPYHYAAPQVITAQNAFLITQALKNVIREGTAKLAAQSLNRTDLAGKTGTTQNTVDAWFNGYNHALETTVWVGFDQPQPLFEFGAKAALPIWIDYMRQALQNSPENDLPQPTGIVAVKIDPQSGLLARPGDNNAIVQYFDAAHVPTMMSLSSGGSSNSSGSSGGSSGSSSGDTAEQQLY